MSAVEIRKTTPTFAGQGPLMGTRGGADAETLGGISDQNHGMRGTLVETSSLRLNAPQDAAYSGHHTGSVIYHQHKWRTYRRAEGQQNQCFLGEDSFSKYQGKVTTPPASTALDSNAHARAHTHTRAHVHT